MMIGAHPLDRPRSLHALAYDQIKALLLSGRLSRDRLYSANDFAETLRISRTPVREALLQLAAENYLVFVEGRGVRVRQFTTKEIRDFFETRQLVEPYVLGQIAHALDPHPLEQNLDLMK